MAPAAFMRTSPGRVSDRSCAFDQVIFIAKKLLHASYSDARIRCDAKQIRWVDRSNLRFFVVPCLRLLQRKLWVFNLSSTAGYANDKFYRAFHRTRRKRGDDGHGH